MPKTSRDLEFSTSILRLPSRRLLCFANLELSVSKWQVEMDSWKVYRTALCQFTVVPFGLCNAFAIFDSLGKRVFRDLHGVFRWHRFDEGNVWKPRKKSKSTVPKVKMVSLALSPKGYRLFYSIVNYTYISHIVVAVDDKKKTIQQWPQAQEKH